MGHRGRWWSHHPWRDLRNAWMWCSGSGTRCWGEVGLDDLRGFFHPWWSWAEAVWKQFVTFCSGFVSGGRAGERFVVGEVGRGRAFWARCCQVPSRVESWHCQVRSSVCRLCLLHFGGGSGLGLQPAFLFAPALCVVLLSELSLAAGNMCCGLQPCQQRC